MDEEILVSDLMQMSAEELRSRGVISVKDRHNLTGEHLEKLKLVVNGLDESRAINLEAVNEKLWLYTEKQNVSKLAEAEHAGPESQGFVTVNSTSSTPNNNDPVHKAEWLHAKFQFEHAAYHKMIRDGGRPSHRPDDSGFDYLYEPQTGIIRYWIDVCANRESIFADQEWNWRDFRRQQKWRRVRYWKPEWFRTYVQHIKDFLYNRGIEDEVCLFQNRKQQSKLQNWKEYQYWEYAKSDEIEQDISRLAEEVRKEEEQGELHSNIYGGLYAAGVDSDSDYIVIPSVAQQKKSSEKRLESRRTLLNWINEQFSIIASEEKSAAVATDTLNDRPSSSSGTSLGKRKRSPDTDDESDDSSCGFGSVEPSDARGSSSTHQPDHDSAGPREIMQQRNENMPPRVNATDGSVQASNRSEQERGNSSWRTFPFKHDQAGSHLHGTRREKLLSQRGLGASSPRHEPFDILRATSLDVEEAEFLKTKGQPASSGQRCGSAPPVL